MTTTLAATTIITREQIQTLQARSVEDLLRGVDGLGIGNSGGSETGPAAFTAVVPSDTTQANSAARIRLAISGRSSSRPGARS